MRMSVCRCQFLRSHRLSASIGVPVLCGLGRTFYAPLSTAACDIITTGPRASVEHDLIACESIQNLVNDFSIIQMIPPVGEHVFHNLHAIEFSHQITPKSFYAARCSNKYHSHITSVLRGLFPCPESPQRSGPHDTRWCAARQAPVELLRTSFDDALRGQSSNDPCHSEIGSIE